MNDIEVRPSVIHGLGVFAKRAFKKGETVLAWDTSHTISPNEYEQLSSKEKGFVAKLGHKLVLMQAPAKYVNHSCDPNTNATEEGKDVAIRDIAAGEEITSNYAADLPPGEILPCICGAKNCKGTVVSSHPHSS